MGPVSLTTQTAGDAPTRNIDNVPFDLVPFAQRRLSKIQSRGTFERSLSHFIILSWFQGKPHMLEREGAWTSISGSVAPSTQEL
jgi:hypothetical protein